MTGILKLSRHLLQHSQDCHDTDDKPRRRSMWVRPVFLDHDACGAWSTLIPQMRACDIEKYVNFFRMTPSQFDRLLDMVGPLLQKFSHRKPICPGERQAITLRSVSVSYWSGGLVFNTHNITLNIISGTWHLEIRQCRCHTSSEFLMSALTTYSWKH